MRQQNRTAEKRTGTGKADAFPRNLTSRDVEMEKRERGVTSRGDQNENVLAIEETRGDRRCIKRKGWQNFQKLEEICCGQWVLVNGLGSSPEAWERTGRALGTKGSNHPISKQPLPACKVELGGALPGGLRDGKGLPDVSTKRRQEMCLQLLRAEALLGAQL